MNVFQYFILQYFNNVINQIRPIIMLDWRMF